MNKFGFYWPDGFDCSNLPEENCLNIELPSNQTNQTSSGVLCLFVVEVSSDVGILWYTMVSNWVLDKKYLAPIVRQ